jgi:hypothetical protein
LVIEKKIPKKGFGHLPEVKGTAASLGGSDGFKGGGEGIINC